MKIYEHPLEPAVTVIEIDKSDENEDFLSDIISGFNKFGIAYNSASFGDSEKEVMYIDCREKDIFPDGEEDIVCALAVGLAKPKSSHTYDQILDACVSIAEAAGEDMLLEKLISKPPEYFDMFKTLKKVA